MPNFPKWVKAIKRCKVLLPKILFTFVKKVYCDICQRCIFSLTTSLPDNESMRSVRVRFLECNASCHQQIQEKRWMREKNRIIFLLLSPLCAFSLLLPLFLHPTLLIYQKGKQPVGRCGSNCIHLLPALLCAISVTLTCHFKLTHCCCAM